MTNSLGVVVTQRDRYDWSEPLIKELLQAVPAGTPVLFIEGGSPPAVADSLRKSADHWGFPTELVKYHALMLRTAFARAHPLLDPAIANVPESLDFSLSVQRYQGRCWLEPAAVAVFCTPFQVEPVDKPQRPASSRGSAKSCHSARPGKDRAVHQLHQIEGAARL